MDCVEVQNKMKELANINASCTSRKELENNVMNKILSLSKKQEVFFIERLKELRQAGLI